MAEDSLFSRLRGWLETPAGKWTAGTVAVAMLAATVLIWVLGSSGAQAKADRFREAGRPAWVFCRNCKHTDRVRVAIDEVFPIQCPRCKQKQAMPGFRCTGCRRVFEHPNTPTFRCPYAGCGQFFDRTMAGGRRNR